MDSGAGGKKIDLTSLRISDDKRSNAGPRPRLPLLIGGAVVVLLALAALIALGGRAPDVRVATARSVAGAGAATLLNASGYIEPRRRATVAAKITARVVEMLADEGMRVEARGRPARLSPPRVTVSVAGPASQVRGLAPSDLQAYVAMPQQGPVPARLPVAVQIAPGRAGVSVIETRPAEVSVRLLRGSAP